jgi:hypothetical protein
MKFLDIFEGVFVHDNFNFIVLNLFSEYEEIQTAEIISKHNEI